MLEGQKITYFGVCLLLQNWHIMIIGFDDGRNSVGLMLPYLFFRFVFCCCNRVVAKKSFAGGGHDGGYVYQVKRNSNIFYVL